MYLFSRQSLGTAGHLILALVCATADASEKLVLEARETAGLARGGYPAQGLLKLPRPVPPSTKLRLLHDGKPIVAQFRPDGEGATAKWWVDFQTEMAPYEKRKYTVEFGDDVTPVPERSQGHKLTQTGDAFLITNAPYITWTVPRDLKGFLRSVDFSPSEFMRADSPGLLLRDRQGRQHAFSGSARVVRQGTMAVALRFEKAESQASLGKVRSTAELTFPVPVSWVEVDWNIDDPLDKVAAVGLELHLKLEKSAAAPTLIEFGTTSIVYTSLRQGQATELSAGPLAGGASSGVNHVWRIVRGEHERMMPFALGPKGNSMGTPPVEGWVHIMDRKNCLALAMDDFARDTHDRISAAADGTLAVWREYSPGKNTGRKRFRAWLHFVFFPHQHTAAASPQQMQTPIEVRIVGR